MVHSAAQWVLPGGIIREAHVGQCRNGAVIARPQHFDCLAVQNLWDTE